MAKDPLCPLGFHPQVRWPTRCKRCFREYKEHAAKKDEPVERVSFLKSKSTDETQDGDTVTSDKKDFSSPYSSISSAALNRLTKIRVDDPSKKMGFAGTDTHLTPPDFGSPLRRNTTDLSQLLEAGPSSDIVTHHLSPTDSSVTIRLRKSSSFTEESSSSGSGAEDSPTPPRSVTPTPIPTFRLSESEDPPSPATVPKLRNGNRSGGSLENLATLDDLPPSPGPAKKKTKRKRLLIKGVQEVVPEPQGSSFDGSDGPGDGDGPIDQNSSADVAFIIQVKSSRRKKEQDDEMSMTTATDTTDTTLIDVSEAANSSGLSLWEFDELKKELQRLKDKCDKLEKEKAEILSRRVSNLDAPKMQSTEYMKLQQKVNQLTTANEDIKDEQKHLEVRNRELEKELAARPTGDFFQRCISELRSKLANAEAEIEKVHEEKRETEQQMNEMQDEFEELQDSFQGDKSKEYSTIKKELDDSNKSCRVLQFKLRKSEKRVDSLEAEKKELENTIEKTKNASKIIQLEEELAKSKAENELLLKESFKYKKNDPQRSPRLGGVKKKSPVLTKAPSGEFVDPPITGDVDPEQLLRDLQSTVERESDLREQLKFAEEEVGSLRQKMSRIEEENESLLIQIKKISTPSKQKVDPLSRGKGSGSDGKQIGNIAAAGNAEAAELKLQLELNEQESKILQRKVVDLEKTNDKLSKDLQNAEVRLETLQKEEAQSVTKSKNVEEVSILRRKIIEKEREVERLEAELQTTKTKTKTTRAKVGELEESKGETRRLQDEIKKLKLEAAATRKTFDEELTKVTTEVDVREKRVGQLTESNQTLLGHVEKFKRDVATMKEHYEAIQDDFVLKNVNLSKEKEGLQGALNSIRKDTETLEKELKALRETFNHRQDTWIKEKLTLQDKMAELEARKGHNSHIPGGWRENPQLKELVKDQTMELENNRREIATYKDQVVFMQRENDELRKQLEDFEKVSQVQIRSISNEPTVKSDKEIKAVRERLQSEEKSHKTEIVQMKMRLDQELAAKSEEISAVVTQLSRAKRERDTYRQMVDSAQRAIAELKSKDNFHRRESVSGLEEAAEGARAAVNTLQERVQALEDELSESRRETARCKTELATENSTWEMRLAEMQQKVNELEEDRLLGSGRSRAPGQKTRLELAWQKERDDQQRRLKEATTLARDLKTTLQEIERERDREKIENRRRLEQMKSALEEEQEELRRKVGESHSDLLELRDAHAKLRTANEKLRRDREKLEKEREVQLKTELEQRRIGAEREKLLDDLVHRLKTSTTHGSTTSVNNLVQNVRLGRSEALEGSSSVGNPAQMTREKRRSGFRRVASAEGGDSVTPGESISISSSAYGKEHYGVSGGVGRTAMKYTGASSSSTLTLPSGTSGANGRGAAEVRGKSVEPQGSLYRKSLSLEQNVSMPEEQRIWRGESEGGSGSSLKSTTSMDSRGSSVDRFSTLSSKSEKPKSKGIMGKMKKLVKSKSIEESQTAQAIGRIGLESAGVGLSRVMAGSNNSDSTSSLTGEKEKDMGSGKATLKDKVKGMFRRSSRSPSAERTRSSALLPEPPSRPSRESTPKKDFPATASLQRPLMPSETERSSQRPLQPTTQSSRR